MPSSMFNVRVEPDLFAAIDRAAADAGVRRSVWAREVLAQAAGFGGDSPHPARFLALQSGEAHRQIAAGTCTHPLTAIRELPFTDVCGVCGTVVRSR